MGDLKICVVGLGYVGLPLAVAFGKVVPIVGFDVKKQRIEELQKKHDSTEEVSDEDLRQANITYTNDPKAIKDCNFIIVAVPTSITAAKMPDFSHLESASKVVGENLSKGSIVVYESTVYPGATEEVCAPIIEKYSGLICGRDFKIGYSPERINPGDKEHTVDKIVKVVAGMDQESTDEIAKVYSMVIKAGVFKAKNIKTAEAAKVIENTQRDLNIALMNELSMIFEKMGIHTRDVLEAAGTKWNFHKYSPGLVGGHCIGVDPYWLTYKAQMLGHHPQVILAGRNINDNMYRQVVNFVHSGLNEVNKTVKGAKVFILGLTFKENITDTRNSKIKDVIDELKKFGANVVAYDPMLTKEQVESFGVEAVDFKDIKNVDCIILATGHNQFKSISLEDIGQKMDRPVLVDVRSFFNCEDAINKRFIYKGL